MYIVAEALLPLSNVAGSARIVSRLLVIDCSIRKDQSFNNVVLELNGSHSITMDFLISVSDKKCFPLIRYACATLSRLLGDDTGRLLGRTDTRSRYFQRNFTAFAEQDINSLLGVLLEENLEFLNLLVGVGLQLG